MMPSKRTVFSCEKLRGIQLMQPSSRASFQISVYVKTNRMSTAKLQYVLKYIQFPASIILYTDKKRSDALSQTLGVQFPNNLRSGGFIRSICHNLKNVNCSSHFSTISHMQKNP